jgi:hypothetical protein
MNNFFKSIAAFINRLTQKQKLISLISAIAEVVLIASVTVSWVFYFFEKTITIFHTILHILIDFFLMKCYNLI